MTAVREPVASRYAIAFIFVTMLVDTIGLGIIIPVAPKIIAQLTGEGMGGAADWGGWLMFVFCAMQFLCAPLIGNLSDRYGRRPVLIVSLLALGVDYLITGLAPTIAWLFIGRILSGIAGASYTTVNAYIADITPPEKRAANFALTGAAFSLGFILGPAAGGLLGGYGARIPFFAAAGLSLANALFGIFVLKESLKPENRRKFELWRANPVGALKALHRFPGIYVLLAVLILMRLAHDANPAVFSFYVYAKFNWTPQMVGYSLMAIGGLMAVVYGFLVRIMVPKIGETASVYLGLLSAATGFAGYAFATQSWMMFAFMLPFALIGFATPALNSIMSKLVGPREQGELQG
ncbi:MAG: TCR/Tet family MFS transporter, partial [Alphaproteobacteria bacterium]|nr:TCR/Tet family MFS transporter [Alphaproteobacteria bacterium]